MQSATIPTAWRNDAPLAARSLSTEELASALKVRPQTIRAGLCRDGHYMGLRPSKLPNRFLLWPASAVDALLNGEVAQ